MIPIPKIGSILALPDNLPPMWNLAGLLDIAQLCLAILAFGGTALVVVLVVQRSAPLR
jgi:hypothetical protein